MANELSTAMAAIATVVDAVSGIRVATSLPPETVPPDPFAMVFLVGGTIEIGPIGTKKSLTNLAIDVLKRRIDLPRDLALLNPYLDSIPLALVGEVSDGGGRFSNSMQTFGDLRLEFLPYIDYGGIQLIGYRFIMENVKILVNL